MVDPVISEVSVKITDFRLPILSVQHDRSPRAAVTVSDFHGREQEVGIVGNLADVRQEFDTDHIV